MARRRRRRRKQEPFNPGAGLLTPRQEERVEKLESRPDLSRRQQRRLNRLQQKPRVVENAPTPKLSERQEKRLGRLEERAASGETLKPKQQKRLDKLREKRATSIPMGGNNPIVRDHIPISEPSRHEPGAAPGAPGMPETGGPSFEDHPLTFGAVNQGAYDLIGGGFDQIRNRGSFQDTMAGLPQLPGVNDFAAERQRAEDAAYDRSASRIQEDKAQALARFEQDMASRGIGMGNEAYTKEKDRLERSYNDQLERARQDAVQAGAQEQSRLFGLGSQARQQMFGENLTGYRMPYEQIGALSPFYQGGLQQNLLGQEQDFAAGQTDKRYAHERGILGQQQDFQRGEREAQQDFTMGRDQTQHGYQRDLADQSNQHRLSQIRATPRAPRTDPFALARLNHELSMQRMSHQSNLSRLNQNAARPQDYVPGSSDILGQAAGAAAAGAINGIFS